MFLQKNHRFIRHYHFAMHGRKKNAPAIPVVASDGEHSLHDAMKIAFLADEALVTAANKDVIEVIEIKSDSKTKTLTFLLHRSSPDAADPNYRKKNGKKISVRSVVKEIDEEQSVSCHLIIVTDKNKSGSYDVYLEEIPGISMTLIQQIFSRALNGYTYEYKDNKGKDQETYTILRSTGVKDETVSNALKGGYLGYITLVRPAKAPFVDADDTFEAVSERMRIRIRKEIDVKKWYEKIGTLAASARKSGWDDFQIDLHTEDNRKKTVKIERGQEGKEIVFVRAEQISVQKELAVCSAHVRDDLVKEAIKIGS